MRPLLRFLGVALLGLLPLAINARAGEPAQSAGAERAAIKAVVAGDYTGNWKGDAEGAGALKISLKKEEARWVAESTFTFEGAEISTKLKSVEVEGAKVQLVFEWAIQGAPGQSRLTGEMKGDGLQGTYETTGEAGNSTGTWTVSRR